MTIIHIHRNKRNKISPTIISFVNITDHTHEHLPCEISFLCVNIYTKTVKGPVDRQGGVLTRKEDLAHGTLLSFKPQGSTLNPFGLGSIMTIKYTVRRKT